MDYYVLVVNLFLANQPDAATQTRVSFETLTECNAALEAVQVRRGPSLPPGAFILSKCITRHDGEPPETYEEVPKG
jgi:hypothetical protein